MCALQLEICTAGPGQVWDVQGQQSSIILSSNTTLCLDAYAAGTADDTNVQAYVCGRGARVPPAKH